MSEPDEQAKPGPEPAEPEPAKPELSRTLLRWPTWLLLPLVATLAFVIGRCAPELPEAGHEQATPHAGHQQEEVWSCSMHPQIRQPESGQCPICGMDLIRVEDSNPEGGAARSDQIVLSERAALLARIETVDLRRLATPGTQLRLLGRVEIDENRVRNVSAWIGGRVDDLVVRETGTVVHRGQRIASMYSAEIYAAHQDLLTATNQVARMHNASELARSSSESTLSSARVRLSLLGMSDREIDKMANASKPWTSVPIRTSYGGTVTERLVTEGQYVETGAVLYRIADLSQLWVQLDVYEPDLASLLVGQTVEIEVEALPGERFTGTVAFIEPILDHRRRVARARVEVENSSAKLRPGMFVEAVVRGEVDEAAEERQKPLVVPVTAPLFTGLRSLVYVEVEGGRRPIYEARVVELGPRMGDYFPVVAGLSPGDRVVVRGAFVLDADLQIRGGSSMMVQPDEAESTAAGGRIEPSSALHAALAELVDAYLGIQAALADDDWGRAKTAALRLRSAADAVDVANEPAEVGEVWAELEPAISRRAGEAADSTAIEGARAAFMHQSMLIKRVLEVFGNPLDEPVRLAFCPMANTNDGAEWIQRGEQIDNSYFGPSMVSCGDFRATVEPRAYLLVAAKAPGAARPGGHQH